MGSKLHDNCGQPINIHLIFYIFSVVPVDSWDNGAVTYDLIGCLNLLDRCDKPMTILQSIKRILKQGTGKAIVAVVLPFEPYVELSKIY